MKNISLKIRTLIVLLFIFFVLSLIIILNTNREELSKTKISENSKVNNMIEKPKGIQAYTLEGEQTDLSYADLIKAYEVESITCKNGTTATFNRDDSSISLSNVKMPDYCTMNFKKGVYVLTYSTNNLVYNLDDVSNVTSEYMTYTVKDKVVTVTGKSDDGYGFINARVYLEANKTYTFNCDTNGVWGTNSGTSTVEAFLMLNGAYNTYYHMISNKNFKFTPTVTGTYWLRLDVNGTNKTYTFSNIDISGTVSTKNMGYKETFGTLPTPSRDGYAFLGWYSLEYKEHPLYFYADTYSDLNTAFGHNENSLYTHYLDYGKRENRKISEYTSASILSEKSDKTIYAGWVKLHKVNVTVSNGSVTGGGYVAYGKSTTYTITANSGYTVKGATVTCTSGTGSVSGSTLTVSNITKDGTCTVTLPVATLYNIILADNPTKSTRSSFSDVLTSTTTGTLYKATEKNVHNTSSTTVYYYAGNTTNNWVKFANFYWRIIRTNADGSVRMLYSGTSHNTTAGYINSASIAFSGTVNNPMYVGYMYGTTGSLASNRTNTNDSTIKKAIDTWYESNLTSYTSYLSTTAVYCNDRNIGSGTYNTGSTNFYFGPYTRLTTNKTPTYDCTTQGDAFSGSNSSAKLKYPIALMTADEVAYAGGVYGTNNASAWFYLNSAGSSIMGSTYWMLLSPYRWSGDETSARSMVVGGSNYPGILDDGFVHGVRRVRPVISVKSTVKVSSGDGTASNPYQLTL